jgi:hypothetical protein
MKKILFALIIGFTSFSAFSNCVIAQKSLNPIAFNNAKNFKLSVRQLAIMETPADLGTYIADEKNVNSKAVKDFQARFHQVSNTMWFADPKGGYVSYFIVNGYGDRAFYDKKGHWQYSLIFYGEDKLPKDIRGIVRSTYYDLAITLVEEVQTTEGMAYVVHLEDKGNIKIVKLSDEGEMETMQELTKE